VTGVVVDEKGTPVPDAEVTIEPHDRSQSIGADVARTDASGKFEIKPHPKKKGLSPGKFAIYVSKWVDKKTKQAPSIPPEELEMVKASGTLVNILWQYSDREQGPKFTKEIKAGVNDVGKLEVKMQ